MLVIAAEGQALRGAKTGKKGTVKERAWPASDECRRRSGLLLLQRADNIILLRPLCHQPPARQLSRISVASFSLHSVRLPFSHYSLPTKAIMAYIARAKGLACHQDELYDCDLFTMGAGERMPASLSCESLCAPGQLGSAMDALLCRPHPRRGCPSPHLQGHLRS